MDNKRNYRIALITNSPAPYRIPAWDALSKVVEQLNVIVFTEKEGNRIWDMQHRSGYSLHVLNSKRVFISQIDDYVYWGGNVLSVLKHLSPTHVIISGYTHVPSIQAAIHCQINRIPLIYWYESHAASSHFRGLVHSLRKFILRHADAWIAAGFLTKKYLISMGIPAHRVVIAPNVVNVTEFSQHAIPHRDGNVRLLYAGRYVPYKGLDILFDALTQIPENMVTLRLVGHGILENYVKKIAQNQENIEVVSAAKTPEEMAEHYAWADVLVFPTFRDSWGLVVNEALASGCYVVASSLAGATYDLVQSAPFDVGVVFNPQDGKNELKIILQNVIARIDEIRSQRSLRQRWGKKFTPTLWRERVIKALDIALNN